jgi:hypothetical protein
MSVGNVNSTERGSGARFNDGKLPMELVPLRHMAEQLLRDGRHDPAVHALLHLGAWQGRGAKAHLYEAASVLGHEGWRECAAVFDYGRKKYAAWNWAKGMAWSIPLACAVRHLMAILDGEKDDPESGLPHRGHVFCNLCMLLTFEKTYPEGDDRAPEGYLQ